VTEVDFTSVESLTAALRGVDAVVSTVSGTALDGQTVLIDAAVAAGVNRFIPSEFGSCTTSSKVENLPVYAPMFKIKRYLDDQAKAGKLTWTVLACGGFMEFVFGHFPFVLDFANHKATLYDEGDNRFSSTSLSNIGKAVAGILKNPEETRNRVVRVSEVILTQNMVLGIAQDIKPELKWEVSKIPASTVLQEGLDGLKAGDFSMPVVLKVIAATAMGGEQYGAAYDETDNEMLGVKKLSEEDLRKLVGKALA
jgi:hypothetical protein